MDVETMRIFKQEVLVLCLPFVVGYSAPAEQPAVSPQKQKEAQFWSCVHEAGLPEPSMARDMGNTERPLEYWLVTKAGYGENGAITEKYIPVQNEVFRVVRQDDGSRPWIKVDPVRPMQQFILNTLNSCLTQA